MGVTPVNLARVSFQMRAFTMQEAVRVNQLDMYRVYNRLSTGYAYLRPSEDPIRASAAVDLEGRLDRVAEIETSLRNANAVLAEVESAMQAAIDLVREGSTLSIESIDDSITTDERDALAVVVNSLIDQLVALGNKTYVNTHLFAGHRAEDPFAQALGGILYRGDQNRRESIVDTDLAEDYFTIPGMEFFGAVSTEMCGVVDLNPVLSDETLIGDLNGAVGLGVELGRIQVTAGTQQEILDLSAAATVGDVIDLLNAQMPGGLTASLGANGINLTQSLAPPVQVTIAEVGGGHTARDLGLVGSFAIATRTGGDLDARVTERTRLTDLLAGAGLNLAQSFVVRNGSNSATVSLGGAVTVEDLLNRINQTDIGIWARIADDGRRLEVRNRVSGTALAIEENGGSLATALGIRSFHSGTRLADLNQGRGVETVTGADLRIYPTGGGTIDVDLSAAATLQDVIDLINAAAGGAVTAGFAGTGNGLRIVDNTGPAGLVVEACNNSPALMDLGLDEAVTGNTLVGRDVNPLEVDSPFTALLELRAGLQEDDRLLMQTAGRRLERTLMEMQRVQGELASQARAMSERTNRVEAELNATRIMLSDVRDVDIADAAVRFQQLETALQANLSVASRVLNLSLLDFLR